INQSRISDIDSLASDLFSDCQSRVPKAVATFSQLSDVHSDLRSQIGGITASVSASDISDIASAVDAILASRLSDILSAAVQTNSRVLLNQSRISDIASFLVAMSGVLSDAYSGIVALSDATSNAYSAAAQASSRALVIQSQASDIYSLLSDVSSA